MMKNCDGAYKIQFWMKKIRQLLHAEDKNDIKAKEAKQINKDVIDYLMKNAYVQNKIEFYMSLDVKVIEHLITASFKQRNMDHERKIFVINLLKKHTFILNIAFTTEKFDYRDLFSFLNLPTVNYDLLNAFEDVLIPFCKKFPQKFLNLLAKNMNVKQTFMNKIYTKQIFKILYTAVFCCDQTYFAQGEQISSEIMNKLIDSIFLYSPNNETIHQSSQNLQYGQVSANLKDFLSDLTTNLDSVDLILVQRFIILIDSEIITKIIAQFSKFHANYDYEDYCQGIIIIFINILKLLESFKLSVNSKSHEKQKVLMNKIQSLLCICAIDITSYLPTYIEFLCEINKKALYYSSGEKIQRVGLLKYRMLELIQKILSINQIEHLNVPFERFDFFPVIITFLQRYKWNSIAHNIIVKITQHILSQDYKNFKLRYLQGVIHANKSLFGQFIIHFRNRKFIFLHSMRMINQGHRSLIFRISQILIVEMQERNDLNMLIDMFKIWKQYMQVDLLEYEEKNYQISLCFNEKKEENSKKLRATGINDINLSQIEGNPSKSLEKIEQILLKFKEQEKWSPRQTSIKVRKQSIMDHQQIKKIDSLAFYIPPAS